MKNTIALSILSFISLIGCAQNKQETAYNNPIPKSDRTELSEEEWQEKLSPQEYNILREKGTERAFTSELNDNKKEGIYVCAACKNELFSSKHKFNSGTGWPSFYTVVNQNAVGEIIDNSYGMSRTEVVCNYCGGHLGHVFEDGPKPTGLRYCINGVSLDFVEK